MRRIETVYLAGPDALAPDGEAVVAGKEALVRAAGFAPAVAARPPPQARGDELAARVAYADTVARLRACDAVIANLTPWRGPGGDPATAFEAGFAGGLGKPVFAYLNVLEEGEADLLGRVQAWMGAEETRGGAWRDADGGLVENLGLPESLMLWAEARRFYVVVTSEPWAELAGLELCLDAVKLYAE